MTERPYNRDDFKLPWPVDPDERWLEVEQQLHQIEFTLRQRELIRKLGRARHEAKCKGAAKRTRNWVGGEDERTHQLSLVGELAIHLVTGLPLDERTYDWGDDGFDHVDKYGHTYETKTSTYSGGGIELKVPAAEWARKVADVYFLVRGDREFMWADIIGRISRAEFELVMQSKQYRPDGPVNYIVCSESLKEVS